MRREWHSLSQGPSDFDLASSVDGDVLIVTFMGQSTAANARAMTTRYFQIVRDSGKKQVLADIRQLKGRLSVGETYLLIRDLPMTSLPVDISTAILETERQRAYADFLETTATNAGVRVKCMVDRAQALAWLRAP
jgi:hypothetical protein